ncbi:hypothetical protein BB559_001757 [Furculomyces boomerangus]|uniref:Ribosomal RNA-processing protein 41 n=1 Tax=Furculomyces boomerangus TaxID=61424 RepID=A0A2T9Z0Q6_9FUNG|nr:hypothetical protein BB559_001757 [Furculomyces boomerangus]
MSRNELVNPEGLRVDGRRANELRKITCKSNVIDYADGSSYYEQGNTKVLVGVFGPRESKQRGVIQSTQVVFNVEFSMAPFSTGERRKRSKNDKRLLEIAAIVKQTFEPVILGNLFSRSQIDVFIHLLQQDGGMLEASINATCLALIDAGIPMIDYVCACAAGYTSGFPLLDLNLSEENSFETPNLTVAILPRSEKIALIQLKSKLSVDKLGDVLELAKVGCQFVHKKLDQTVKTSTADLINKIST